MDVEHLVIGITAVFVVLIVVMWVLADDKPSNRDRR